jgi:stage II sporulation protein D
MSQPAIKVGIYSRTQFQFTIKGTFSDVFTGRLFESGRYRASITDGTIQIGGLMFDQIHLQPLDALCEFTLHRVTIGVGFHWQRDEDQVFKGDLIIQLHGEKLVAINCLPIDDYLTSVISSEMSATSSLQLLKAHAVISRSWLWAQIEKNQSQISAPLKYQSHFTTDTELTRWYDREDHEHFDVCADDHCQRYQGIARVTTSIVEQAVSETKGLVLTYDGKICDARFSKCCGGITELFENCWEPINHPYLQCFADAKDSNLPFNLRNEVNANAFIKSSPSVFCNTSDESILAQVLNNYDRETHQFFRWKVEYSQQELSELLKLKTTIDFGLVTELIPLTRGASGRITRLKIVGTKKTYIIGKELEIRKALSKTHLYSSAFVVEVITVGGELKFILHGAGWGHGVGLCQIGAAVMGEKGYFFDQILMHYFRGAGLESRY